MSEFFTENECAKQLLEISSVHQIKSLFDEWDRSYGLDDNEVIFNTGLISLFAAY